MSTAGSIKKNKLEENMRKRLERGALKAAKKQARKDKKNANS